MKNLGVLILVVGILAALVSPYAGIVLFIIGAGIYYYSPSLEEIKKNKRDKLPKYYLIMKIDDRENAPDKAKKNIVLTSQFGLTQSEVQEKINAEKPLKYLSGSYIVRNLDNITNSDVQQISCGDCKNAKMTSGTAHSQTPQKERYTSDAWYLCNNCWKLIQIHKIDVVNGAYAQIVMPSEVSMAPFIHTFFKTRFPNDADF